jgi:hypothetical protein
MPLILDDRNSRSQSESNGDRPSSLTVLLQQILRQVSGLNGIQADARYTFLENLVRSHTDGSLELRAEMSGDRTSVEDQEVSSNDPAWRFEQESNDNIDQSGSSQSETRRFELPLDNTSEIAEGLRLLAQRSQNRPWPRPPEGQEEGLERIPPFASWRYDLEPDNLRMDNRQPSSLYRRRYRTRGLSGDEESRDNQTEASNDSRRRVATMLDRMVLARRTEVEEISGSSSGGDGGGEGTEESQRENIRTMYRSARHRAREAPPSLEILRMLEDRQTGEDEYESGQYCPYLRRAHYGSYYGPLNTSIPDELASFIRNSGEEPDFPDITSCSWLRPGVQYAGTQRPAVLSLQNSNRVNEDLLSVEMTIDYVDYKNWVIAGSVTLCELPIYLAAKPVRTSWEGELIDFPQFCQLALKHRSNRTGVGHMVQREIAYMQRIYPFSVVDRDKLMAYIENATFVTRLQRKYIFMRWKSSHDDRMYFMMLRRGDGTLEGYMYEASKEILNQKLVLNPKQRMSFPAYTFQ